MELEAFLDLMVRRAVSTELVRLLTQMGFHEEVRRVLDMLPPMGDDDEREKLRTWKRHPGMRPSVATALLWRRCRGSERLMKGAVVMLVEAVKGRKGVPG